MPIAPEGRFIPVNMDRCQDLIGGLFEHVTLAQNTKVMPRPLQGLSIPFACIGSSDPVRALHLYTMNTLDTLEAFIAETYVQLVATKSMCYCSNLTL